MKYLKNLWHVCCAVFISGCLGQIDFQYSKNPINDISPVSLKLNTPSQSASNTAAIEIQADGSPGASIQLFSDPLCLHSLESKSTPSGTTVFTLTLEDFGKYNFYALQTKDSKTSTCTSAPLTYSYLPPKITALTSPLGLSDVGVVPDIQIAAQSIVKNSLVTFYSAPGCLSPSVAGSAPEIQNSATISLSLSSDGQYEYYANQSINGVTSECSSVKLSYALRRTCDSSDLAATGYARGTGSKLDPFIICSPTQFNRIGSQASDWNKSFTILESLNFNSIPVSRIGGDSCSIAQFTGEIDGNNKELSNITINGTTYAGILGCFNGTLKNVSFKTLDITGTNYVGIIAYSGKDDSLNTVARISGVKVDGAIIRGSQNVGTLVGYAVNTELENNTVTGLTLTPTGTATQGFGGIAGFVEKLSTINKNTVSITINGTIGTHAGGIVGILRQSSIRENHSSGTISQRKYAGGIAGQIGVANSSELGCLAFSDNSSSISISGATIANAQTFIGGLVGYHKLCDAKRSSATGNITGFAQIGGAFGQVVSSNLKEILAAGNVLVKDEQGGGLVGYSDVSTILKSTAKGDVSSSNGAYAVGGFVGYLDTSEVINSFSTGSVNNTGAGSSGTGFGVVGNSKIHYFYSSGEAKSPNVRGFLGAQDDPTTYVNNYYLTSTSPSAINGVNAVEAKSMAELQNISTFTNWNFNFVWKLIPTKTPELNTNRASGTFYVSNTGNDANDGSINNPWKTLTFAASEVGPGDTIIVRGGIYQEAISIMESGKDLQPITFQNYSGEIAEIKFPSPHPSGDSFPLIRLHNTSNIIISGFEMSDIVTSNVNLEPAGILVTGHGKNITLQNLKIHDIKQQADNGNAHGILVRGTDALGLKNIKILNNEAYGLETGWSEVIAINGNIDGFLVEGNHIRDNNNIGIDLIGYEKTCVSCPNELDRARNGLVRGNTVLRSTSATNPSYQGDLGAVGIYVDGGKDIVIELNWLEGNDWGIELSSERGTTFFANNIIVRNNMILNNKLAGIVLGGTNTSAGCVDCYVVNNTFYNNDTFQTDGAFGEIHIQNRNTNVKVYNNILYAITTNYLLRSSGVGNSNIEFDNNLYYLDPSISPRWNFSGQNYTSFADFKAAGFEANGLFAKPLVVGEPFGDFRPIPNSPTVGAGKNLPAEIVGAESYGNKARTSGSKIDIGAHQL